MANLKLAIRSNVMPDLFHSGKVETVKDLRKFLKGADVLLQKVAKVFPAAMDGKITVVKLGPDA